MGLILENVEGMCVTVLSRRIDRSGVLTYPYFVDFIHYFYIITPLLFSFIHSFICYIFNLVTVS